METTIVFPNYNRDSARLDDPKVTPAETQHRDYEGLSVYNIPVSVEAVLDPATDSCIITFEYTDEEESDGIPRPVPGDEKIALVFGKNAKKIIEVRIDRAKEYFARPSLSFDPRLVMLWARDLPPRQAKILSRNSVVVSNILDSIPERLRNQFVRLLDS